MRRTEMQIMPMVDYPIVPPHTATVDTIFADGELDPEVIAPPMPTPDAAKMFLLWGSAGVVIGAVVTMGITALSFRSYRKSKSAVGPALWAGGGAVVTGFLLLLAMRKALKNPSTGSAKLLALATGANAAT